MTGHYIIKMTELSSLFNRLGFQDADTYIQSGNVVFSNSGKLNVNNKKVIGTARNWRTVNTLLEIADKKK